ncbi:MAG: phage tail protein [Oxalobacter sp.]|nr:phage tail protein [Oxalobacter sp.]
MYKPDSLRKHLSGACPILKRNPEILHIFVDEGNVVAVGTNSFSHEYQYRLNIHIEDYAGPIEAITVPLLTWVIIHQIELLSNPDQRKTGISFDVDFNNNDTKDILIRLRLTEKSIVTQAQNGKLNVKAQQEPQPTPEYVDKFWELYKGDTLIAEWYTPKEKDGKRTAKAG